MKRRSFVLTAATVGVFATAIPLAIRPSAWFIWNASASVPIGLYLVEPASRLDVDEMVVVRPPEDVAAFLAERGYLPHGAPLLKQVLALPGQTVCRMDRTITVDFIAMGDARDRDSRGRKLPVWQGCRVLAADEVFLMNRSAADSFDSRYFGPLLATSIVGRARALWIAKEK